MMNRRELLGSAGAISILPVLPAFADAPDLPTIPAFEATLQLGPSRSGAGNHRWAEILNGSVAGECLVGSVQSGRLDWVVDPCTGAADARMQCQIQCGDGRVQALTVHGLRPVAAGRGRVRVTVVTYS